MRRAVERATPRGSLRKLQYFDRQSLSRMPSDAVAQHEPRSTCRWLLLAGDSNTRALYHQLASLVMRLRPTWRLRQWPSMRPNSPVCGKCGDTRWNDRELLVRSASKRHECLLISLRFLVRPNEFGHRVARSREGIASPRVCSAAELRRSFVQAPPASVLCGELRTFGKVAWSSDRSKLHFANCTSTIPATTRKQQPDAVYLSHGLWGVDGNGRCDERFAPEVVSLLRLKALGVHVQWATHFPIQQHSRITNAMLERDNACQRDIAARAGLADAVLDLEAKAHAGRLAVDSGWHLTKNSSAELAARLLRDAGLEGLLGAKRLRDVGVARPALQPVVADSCPALGWRHMACERASVC